MGTGSQPAATTNNNVVAVGFVLGATVRGARLSIPISREGHHYYCHPGSLLNELDSDGTHPSAFFRFISRNKVRSGMEETKLGGRRACEGEERLCLSNFFTRQSVFNYLYIVPTS